MKKLLLIPFLLILAGCIKLSYTTLDEVPERQKPIYNLTHAFMECSGDSYFEKLSGVEVAESPEGMKPVFQQTAQEAVEQCAAELEQFRLYVKEKTSYQDIAQTEADTLRQKTIDHLVDVSMAKLEEILAR